MDIITKRMRSNHRSIILLVAAVSFHEKKLTAFLIVASFVDGYMLIASTDYIVTLYLFISNSSSII